MRRIAAHYLIDRGRTTPRPIITLDDEGIIVEVAVWEQLDRLPDTEFYAGAICAGFINAHCHSELSYLCGAIERGTGFGGFARAIGQVRGGFTPEEREQALLSADKRMWWEGVDAVADIVNDASSFGVKSRSRIRYRNFAEVFGLLADVDDYKPLTAYPATSLTPHSTYSLQDSTFRLSAAADLISIHFMESDDEQALYRGEGSLAAWYERMGWECDFLRYGSPAGRVVGSLPSDKRLLLVHNCRLQESDYHLITNHFESPVAWVLCPRSNDYISGLRPPVELLRRHRALVCIGTDSLASNSSLSIVEELKALPEVPLAEAVEWATINGAKALGLEAELGSVEVGKRSGIVLLEGLDFSSTEPCLTVATTSRRLA